MTNGVELNVATVPEKVYSKDKNLYVGMKKEECAEGSQLLAIFDFADKDKNGEISTTEINRYNGPVFVYSKWFGDYVVNPSEMAQNIQEGDAVSFDTEIEFYAGLTESDIPEKGKNVFAKIDTDANKVLSAEEVNKAVDEFNEKKKLEKEVKEQAKEKASGGPKEEGSFFDSIPKSLKIAGAALLGMCFGGGLGLLLGAASGWFFSRD